jgi:hypothetical protein
LVESAIAIIGVIANTKASSTSIGVLMRLPDLFVFLKLNILHSPYNFWYDAFLRLSLIYPL